MNKAIVTQKVRVLPKQIYEGIIIIQDKELLCGVLEDGTRIITQASLFKAFGKVSSGGTQPKIQLTNTAKLPTFLRSGNLEPYVLSHLEGKQELVEFIGSNYKKRSAYNAEIIPLICEMYLKARDDGKLYKTQLVFAQIAESIIRSFAKIGINALIDEATGYQQVRSDDALQLLLQKYLTKDMSSWSKKFPDEFYKQIFRLKGWQLNKSNFTKRPGIVGTITNQIVYNRLAPEIVEELKRINPKNELGHRDNKHHQFLTMDIGQEDLNKHLYSVIGLMKGFNKWEPFRKILDRCFPIKTRNNFEKDLNK